MRKIPLFWLAAAGSLSAEQWPAADLEFFEREVRPVLVERCYKCHSTDAKKLKGGLYLDSREGVLEGGDSGPAIVPGKPDASRLIEGVRYKNVDFQMPPKSRLEKDEVQALEKWVTLGAPWPKEESRGEARKKKQFDLEGRRRDHWCWQPMKSVAPPAVIDGAWPRGAIDRFILAALEERGLEPAKDADRRSFVRRITFDLIGLPPSPAEVEAFVNDDSPQAVERLVDRLLASPHFGEKWARHWMDLVRYGESYGHEFDYNLPHAPSYRDYLIRAFNADVPYDAFLTEHIAGDLVDNPRMHPEEQWNEAILGTGFWWLGEAVHAPTDIRGDEADRIDNQLDVFSRGFLGLTVACARCHDHKFDAISTADYYAMAGFLQGTRRHYAMLDPAHRIEKGAVQLREVQAKATAALQGRLRWQPFAPGGRECVADFDAGLPDGWTTRGEAFPAAPTPLDRPVVSLGDGGVAAAGVMDSGIHGNKLQGVLRSPTFTLEGPKLYVLMKSSGPVQVRIVVDGHFMHEVHNLLVKGTILKDKGANTKGKWEWKEFAQDLVKYVGHEVYLEFSDLGDGAIAIDEIAYERPGGYAAPPTHSLAEGAVDLEPYFQRASKIEEEVPAPVRALATADGTAENEHIHIRGSHQNLGEEVPRKFLTALGGREVPAAEPGSGRLHLAAQVTDPENPLTARVIVNRLWHHLTGRGIVPTVDDFGEMGMEPSHPELLDWMARDFVANGWSIKRTIRLVVTSRAYAMSCEPAAASAAVAQHDPENIFLHKFRVRRLTGEAIRDGVLATSGRLDRKMFGDSVPVHLTTFMEGRGRPKKNGPLDGAGRRSIYIAIRRNFLPDFQMAFDMPSPFSAMGRRSVSNVPAQALVMMNDPFVIEQAAVWAKRLGEEVQSQDERIARAYLEAFSREPSVAEAEAARKFLAAQAELHRCSHDDPKVWADFCHVLFNQKEYIFLR